MQSSTETISGTGETVEGMMVLGRHLENPYSVENVRKAFCELYPTKSPRMIVATNLYVRFLPSDERELAVLDSIGVDTFDFPLDYEISRDGDFYHDPSLPQDRITWQYAVVPKSFNFPEGIEYEILDDCCFAEVESLLRSGSDVDWDEVERRSFELTGNAGLLEPESRASAKATPKGKITIYDNGSGEQVGVEGVKVLVNTLLKYSSAYTDKYGNYQISTRFSSKPHYRLRFHNQTGFSIGLNLILLPMPPFSADAP